jgi:hypothetical protein
VGSGVEAPLTEASGAAGIKRRETFTLH